MEEIKITEEELAAIKEIQSNYQKLVILLGQLELEQQVLDEKAAEYKAQFRSIRSSEARALDNFKSKYGIGTLNLEKGTFVKV